MNSYATITRPTHLAAAATKSFLALAVLVAAMVLAGSAMAGGTQSCIGNGTNGGPQKEYAHGATNDAGTHTCNDGVWKSKAVKDPGTGSRYGAGSSSGSAAVGPGAPANP